MPEGIRAALGERDLWIVAGFIFFWTFSPSLGPALLYYQTDVLTFSQQFIGHLGALGSLNVSIGVGVAGTLLTCSIGTPGRPSSSRSSSAAWA